jgi:diacylglycerol kinase (ATP)
MRARSLLWSLDYAIQGIVFALRTQRNMRLHALAAAVVLLSGVLLGVTRLEMIALLFAITFVFVAELVNTSLEAAVDIMTEHFDPMAKTAKDVAAGAVLVASLNALAVGYLVFFDRATRVAEHGFLLMRRTPSHLTMLAIALTALAVLAVKAGNRDGGSFVRGGWPSGHTAVAISGATAIGYITDNAAAGVLALFVAALVAQSRVESGTHTIPQVVLGGLLGFLITTMVFQVFFA